MEEEFITQSILDALIEDIKLSSHITFLWYNSMKKSWDETHLNYEEALVSTDKGMFSIRFIDDDELQGTCQFVGDSIIFMGGGYMLFRNRMYDSGGQFYFIRLSKRTRSR